MEKNKFFDEDNWLREEEVRESAAPGLFSLSPKWFRHSEYEIIGLGGASFGIKPIKGATLEWYKPFEEFPDILEDFLRLVVNINNLYEGKKGRDIERDKQVAEEFLSFISKYGHFGLYWEHIKNEDLPIGYYGGKTPPEIEEHNRRYLEKQKHYFPTREKPWPYIFGFLGSTTRLTYEDRPNYEGDNVNELFLADYTEMPIIIETNNIFIDIKSHFMGKNENFSIGELGLNLSRDRLEWNFSSLIKALGIMYINNKAGSMGEKVSVCHLEGCNKIVRGKKYCDNRHADADRQRRRRNKLREREVNNNG